VYYQSPKNASFSARLLGKRSEASGPDAFSELYHRYLPGIYRYHLARTGHVQEAEDLTAQTFLTALESIASFRGQGSFASWLFGIASHKLADHYRRSRIELPLEEAEDLHSQAPLPEEALCSGLIWIAWHRYCVSSAPSGLKRWCCASLAG
jgi:DNA-directed RNA polymerase specialized sigma24 family protein